MTPGQLIELNRQGRRSRIGKRLVHEQHDLIDLGECYYCHKPVMASSGQAIKFKRLTHNGETVDNIPTHKRCRKVLS